MSGRTRGLLLCSSALLVALTAPAVNAQQAATNQNAIPEVTVSALRQSQSLKDTPASVSVLDSNALESAGVRRPDDIIALTPGVSIVSNTAEPGDTQVNIRGINGARDAENSFAFVLDGILMSNPAAFNREFTDLDQIEVLKGPQGALYGRNAAAGAIVVTTTKPTNQFEAMVKSSIANNSSHTVQGTSSGPIIKDQLWVRLSADYADTDGFYTNRFTKDHSVDNFSNYNINARLIWDPTPGTEFDLKGRYGHIDASAIAFNAAFELPGFTGFLGPAIYENVNQHAFEYVNNIKPESVQDSREVSLKVTHEMDWAKLTAWFLYSDIDNAFLSDGTAGAFGFYNKPAQGYTSCANSLAALAASGYKYPAPQSQFLLGPYTSSTCDGYQYQVRNQNDYSGEIRLTSNQGGPMTWSGGLYYLHIDREVGVSIGADQGTTIIKSLYDPLSSVSPTAQLYDDSYTTNVYAAFGSVGYDITPTLNLLAAFRYDVEVRDTSNLDPVGARQPFVQQGAGAGPWPLNPGFIANPNGIPSRSKTFDQPEPRLSLSWKLDPDVTVYGAYGVGFKSGGFNAAGSAATVAQLATFTAPTKSEVVISDDFKKEVSNALEVGIKGRSPDRKFNFEFAGFYTMVNDMQFFEFFSGPAGLLRVVDNIDRVDIRGFEAGAQYKMFSNLSLFAGFEFNDSEILQNNTRPSTKGNKSPYTPDFTANAGAQFTQEITDSIAFVTRLDATIIGPTWFSTVQNQSEPSIFGAAGEWSQTQRDTYTTVNLRTGFQTDHLSITAFAKNLFNEHYLSEVIPAPEFGGAFIAQGPGRLIGVEASYKF